MAQSTRKATAKKSDARAERRKPARGRSASQGKRQPTAGRKRRTRGRPPLPASAAYLGDTHQAVRSTLEDSSQLAAIRASLGQLTKDQRELLVRQARVLLEENYVHLPLKQAMHAVDPIQRLRLLQHRLEQTPAAELPSELRFHREMTEIFNSVRDLHTNYVLPAPFQGMQAFLPFDVEQYFEDGEPRYLVSHVVSSFQHDTFEEGVELVRWNGVPIDRAVEIEADRHAGSNLAARQARGLERLTFRPLAISPPPDEEWVLVDYRTAGGEEHQLRFDWLIFPLPDDADGVDPDEADGAAACLGVDLELDLIQRAKKILFAPGVVATEKRLARRKRPLQGLASNMPSKLEAREVDTPSGTFGYVRIRSFNVRDPDAFVAEFIRLVELLPPNGLILDVRGNGGGHIFASEFLLQTLTPHPIEPEPTQFVNTPLNLRLCRRHEASPLGIDLSPWVESLGQAVEIGHTYSRGFPISPADGANAIGQRYHGPVVLVTDARCYSATDIFAAGFQDHEIGPILAVDDNTGAGGANVWTHGLLSLLFARPDVDPDTPYEPLPGGASMRVSIRRTLRVGDRAGTPLEDLGVTPSGPDDERYLMTRRDLLEGNADLIARAGEILAGRPQRRLEVIAQPAAAATDDFEVEVSSAGITRIDAYVDGRPLRTLDVDGETTTFTLGPLDAGAAQLEVRGYDGGDLVASRRVAL